VDSNGDAAHNELALGAILRAFLPSLPYLLKLGVHRQRVLWQLGAWYAATGRQSLRLSALPPSALGTTLLREPALSSLPSR
jgi:hypothetical protein